MSHLTLDQAADALACIPPDDRSVWVSMAMALKQEYGQASYAVWDAWSACAKSYNRKHALAVWKSIKRAGRVTMGSLIFEAKQHGFVMPREDLSEEQRQQRQQQGEARRAVMQRQLEQEEADRSRRAAHASMRASRLWRMGSDTGVSPYLARKCVAPESVKFLPDGTLVVPMIRYDLPRAAALVGAQSILPDGSKRFTPGTAKRGSACRLGLVEVGAPLLVCEGYATGCSIRMALDGRYPVFVAFDAGNLVHVVEILRGLYPSCPILICADDDWRTPGNPGRTKAREISRKVPFVHIIAPAFGVDRADKDTDFNDLHLRSGLAVVARQFSAPLAYLRNLKVRVAKDVSHGTR
jgi:putative DNA primase/helicase